MSRQIVWDDLDKKRYYFWGCTVFLGIRVCVYPTNLIKTRLQVQKGTDFYRGSYDAFLKVFKSEGILGFYRGFPIFALGVFFGQAYITTYEYTKHKCSHMNLFLQGLLPGCIASIAGQSLSVPADVITQRLQIQGMKKPNLSKVDIETGTMKKNTPDSLRTVCSKIMKYDGISGFYRGYFISLMSNVPTSGIWWASYNVLLQEIGQHFEADSLGTHTIPVQATCGVLSGAVSAFATNPLDVMRTRIQTGGSRSLVKVTKKLWGEEGISMFTKGLTARALSMSTSSLLIIMGYETVKRLSFKHRSERTLQTEAY